ncbi:response regulator [Streptantibioticus silvisoli]|uniref:Response regulator transcription factor n=1 Tax=Streptantibioticus silvisoli TaxID=2705255 RepID=A0ABT6VX46_9ACTN|nr:response regulator transcription factor [Streptantibioticus silvisoli]MDI5963053.1 response regulator transcription factor [Streptantibioticus silvisoli]
MRRVLIVDDEPQLLRALKIGLTARGYQVSTARDGGSALRLASRRPPDLVLLDLGLPDVSGLDVIEGLRAGSSAPIIVLSGRTDTTGKIAAFDAGADDYVTKPFDMGELLARLRAVLRRPPVLDAAAAVDIGGYHVDLATFTITATGEGAAPVHLTPTEWRLLVPLLRNPGRVVTGHQLLREVWGAGSEKHGNYLRVYFATLRSKLEPDRAHPRHLITEAGIGYRFQP